MPGCGEGDAAVVAERDADDPGPDVPPSSRLRRGHGHDRDGTQLPAQGEEVRVGARQV